MFYKPTLQIDFIILKTEKLFRLYSCIVKKKKVRIWSVSLDFFLILSERMHAFDVHDIAHLFVNLIMEQLIS